MTHADRHTLRNRDRAVEEYSDTEYCRHTYIYTYRTEPKIHIQLITLPIHTELSPKTHNFLNLPLALYSLGYTLKITENCYMLSTAYKLPLPLSPAVENHPCV